MQFRRIIKEQIMIIKNAAVYNNGKFRQMDLTLNVGNAGVGSNFNNAYVFPAFCDVHVHFREPGFFIKKRSKAARLRRRTGDIPMSAPCRI